MRPHLSAIFAFACALTLVVDAAHAGDLYGNIRLRDYETGKERPLARQVRIVVQTNKQRIETTSRKGSTYYVTVPQEGRFILTMDYAGESLSAEIGSYYSPNRLDLIILYRDGDRRLVVEGVREYHTRPQDKDPR